MQYLPRLVWPSWLSVVPFTERFLIRRRKLCLSLSLFKKKVSKNIFFKKEYNIYLISEYLPLTTLSIMAHFKIMYHLV